MNSFENKTVLITGSARGIGYEIARHFAMAKANVVITDISPSVKEAENKLKTESQNQGNILSFIHDVTKEAECEKIVDMVVQKFGSLEILVNNAGITKDNLVLRMKEKDFDDVMAVNLKGAFFMSKAAFKHMSRKRYGKIINISSIVGQTGQAGQANYAASKAGLIGLTKSMAKEFAKRNVNVNAIAPGFIETDMTKSLPEETRKKILEQIPLQRMGKPEDVANATLFLACDESNYITGHVLAINGGIYI